MRSLLAFSLVFLTGFAATVSAVAGPDQVEFSAEVVQTLPQQGSRHGRIFVGNDRVRTEMTIGGRKMIQIIDMKQQTAYMIDPAEKSYMERKAGPGEMMPAGSTGAKDANPCTGMQNLSCKRVGVEAVNGRPAEKWEVESASQSGSGKMTVWIDQARKMPIRQIFPDGSSMEMHLVGEETLNGRATEKWEMRVTRPGGQSSVGYQWFDPVLKTNIRDEQPGGFVNELRDIKVGTQPADLFVVPPGYTLMSVPEQGAPGQPGQGSYP